jgi:hypothetical protein
MSSSAVYASVHPLQHQGTLTEGEGSVQLTSLFRKKVLSVLAVAANLI